MRRRYLKLGSVVAAATTCAFIYIVSIILDLQWVIILGLFILSVVATIWMVLRILKDPYTTTKTFDDYFYQDRDDIRRSGRE